MPVSHSFLQKLLMRHQKDTCPTTIMSSLLDESSIPVIKTHITAVSTLSGTISPIQTPHQLMLSETVTPVSCERTTSVSPVNWTSTPCSSLSCNQRASGTRACRSLLSAFSESSSIICRICHDGEKNEELISPCQCSGTMGLMHQTCIEKWLSSSNSNRCEICDFEYKVCREAQPFVEWLRNPSRPTDRRNLIGDLVCFFLLTPLATVSIWLCLSGATHYANWDTEWEASGLVALSLFLLLIYLIWCLVALRYHCRLYMEWKEKNQKVRVIGYNSNECALINATRAQSAQQVDIEVNTDLDIALTFNDQNTVHLTNSKFMREPSDEKKLRFGNAKFGKTKRLQHYAMEAGLSYSSEVFQDMTSSTYLMYPLTQSGHCGIPKTNMSRTDVSDTSCKSSHSNRGSQHNPSGRTVFAVPCHYQWNTIQASSSDTVVCLADSAIPMSSSGGQMRWSTCESHNLKWKGQLRETFV